MKFVILESKLKKSQYKYLDSFVDEISFPDSSIVVWGKWDEYGTDIILMEYDYSDGRLYIYENFLITFISNLTYSGLNGCKIISDWFENKFEVEVKYCDS
jgi:hypothetical protein